MIQTRGHIRPDDFTWEQFYDPHERPTTPVRVLKDNDPFLIEADFPPNFYADLHWHPHDTLYLVTRGEMRIGDEGSFRNGSLRWVRAGHAYGPEEASDEGTRFHLFSLGGGVDLNWADLYDVPGELKERLKSFSSPVGDCLLSDLPDWRPGDKVPDWEDMPKDGPLVFNVRLGSAETFGQFGFDFDNMVFVVAGQISLDDGTGVAAGDFYWAKAGETYAATAGNSGADLLVFATFSRDQA